MLITIDGPAGAGKTTVSRILAQRLGYRYVDTGALYRGIALAALGAGIDLADDDGLKSMVTDLDIGFTIQDGDTRLMLGNHDITEKIRTPQVTMAASTVSARPVVREFLLKIQHNLGHAKKAVFEGRDMGTVVFPGADVKFYLDASVSIRAKRRFDEFKGHSAQDVQDVEADIRRRDADDSTRAVAPLRAAGDAIVIDATNLSVEQVVAAMLKNILP
ncbi:MAG: (d)CMP kinase [Deltaproteobacteria bacterium]|nr:(d)CMP kinase [Deltaproteobacteria bacterium]MBW2679115.1 (d)CMP kinase [Deltaproteobacteria bacterium]